MKRILIIGFSLLLLVSMGFAGGMVHNSNHSADYIAMMNRNASTDVDAAFFNPAGLTKLNDGLSFYVSNQTVFQTRTVEAAFPAYNSSTFEGETFAPVFPNLYLVWKSGKMAISGGFMPIGGGGSAEFPNGLPSFDYLLARLVGLPAAAISPALAPFGNITGYDVTASFIGSSVYFAGQGNFSYALNDLISVAVGVRYVYALNTYEGSLEDAILTTDSQAGDIVGLIPNIVVDSKRTGSAITPTVSVNLSPTEAIDFSIRFEPKTELVLTSETTEDGTGAVLDNPMFPDDTDYNEDLPMQLSFGLGYQLNEKLGLQGSFDYWDNTSVNWDGREENVTTNYEAGLGCEYALSEKMEILAGYLYAATGATPEYQTDLSYGLNTSTLGAGLRYHLSQTSALTLGFSNTFYQEGVNDDEGSVFEEKYNKTARVIAIGFQKTR